MADTPLAKHAHTLAQGGSVSHAHTPVDRIASNGVDWEKFHGSNAANFTQQGGCDENGTFVVGMLVRCEICGKKFINSFYLEKHVNKRHRVEVSYPAELSDAGVPTQLGATMPLQTDKGGACLTALMPYSKGDSHLAAEHCSNAPAEIKSHAPRSVRHPARVATPTHVTVPQVIFEQNEVLLRKLQSSNEKVKADVHKEVNDVLKTFQTMLKNEIRGLQTQLAGLEVAGESRRQVEEVTSDSEIPRCTDLIHERLRAKKERPESAPERKLASVEVSPDAEERTSRSAAETLRQAIHTLLTFSHREFFLRSQMTTVVNHNSKPSPEDVERQLGLPALSISSQLTKSFLAEGFQQCHRSGLTTGNAPQNFELVSGAPLLFGRDSSCPYHFHRNRDFFQRRFSLKLFRWRDRLRMRLPSSEKVFASPATGAYMGLPEMTQQTIPHAFGRGQAGYRQMQSLSYSCSSPLTTYPAIASGTGAPALVFQEQIPSSFEKAQPSIGRSCSHVEVHSYTPEETPPQVGVHGICGPQKPQPDCHLAQVANGSSGVPHIIRTSGVSSIHASCPANGGEKGPFQERAKSVLETNCVRLAYPADSPLREPCLRGTTTFDCPKNIISPCTANPEGGSQHGAWPCPSSWIAVHSNDIGCSQGRQPLSPALVNPAARLSPVSAPSTREKKDLSASAMSGHSTQKYSEGDLVDLENAAIYAGGESRAKFTDTTFVHSGGPSLLHQGMWQYAVQEDNA